MTIARVIARTGTDKMSAPLDAQRRAFADTTTVTVINECPFKKRADVIENQVMNHPVAEIGGENFAPTRFFDDKTGAGSDLVNAVRQLASERQEI